MTVIKDGTGTGFLARIDLENLLETHSVTTDEYAHESIAHGGSYRILGTTTITAATEKTVLIVINDSDDLITVDRVTTSIQGESGKPATFKTYIGRRTYTSGGTSVTPINLYANSAKVLDISAYYDNPTLGGSDSQIQQAFMETTTTLDTQFDSAIVLPPNSSIRITITGDAAAAGTKIAFSRLLYYRIDESLHE